MFGLTPYRRNQELYDPFRMFDEMEKNFFRTRENSFKVDIRDEKDHYLLEADMPGVAKENISIDVAGGFLTISAKREQNTEEKDEKTGYMRRERSYGSFSRSFDMSGIREEDIKANYENGVLKLVLPKENTETPTSRRIAIE
ncbi:MAG: Hsp20/alpha crystallin family protein [Clostridiales bacterium]|nr:Hsp20/alpha crystallin family protein [Clostridiales bacterium]